jgi:hypothetical protein
VGSASKFLVGEQSEPALDLVEPGGVGGGEVHVEAGVGGEPGDDGWGLVGAVVVADQVHVQVGGNLFVEFGEELFELGGAVAAVDRVTMMLVDNPRQYFESRE